MRRWLALVVPPVAFCVVTTLLLTAKITTPENRSPRQETEFDYMTGNGLPPGGQAFGDRRVQRRRERERMMREAREEEGGDLEGSGNEGGGEEDGDRRARRPRERKRRTRKARKADGGDPDESGDEGGEEEGDAEAEGEGGEGEGEDDDFHAKRPKKKPKGVKWKGWPRGRGAKDGAGSDKKQPWPNDIFESGRHWWRNQKLCFEVDFLCHGREKNEWFYYMPPEPPASVFQPTMELKPAPCKYDGGRDWGEKRISINVTSSSVATPGEFNERKCRVSRSPAHVVLQSLFNDMIGEFYARTLLRLHQFMTDGADGRREGGADDDKDGDKLPWEELIQFYVHIPYGNKRMLDGHKLLLSGMLSNPDSPTAKSLLDLFVRDEEGAKDADADGGDCQCYQKMVFCGYDVYTHNAEVKSKDLDPAKEDDDDAADESSDASDGAATDIDVKYTLWSAGKLDRGLDVDKGSCGRNSGSKGTEYDCRLWDGLRNFLSSNFARHYPTLEEDLAGRRRELLLEKGAIDDSYTGDTKEYTVVGFTQRTYRRAWLNLPEILGDCEAAELDRTICVEINVENAATPFDQLLLHRSLDVMVGVHGAQLTQAVLLPDHAHILELLPWITNYIRGKWVQTTNGPTPLGVIFHNTNLNHVGFSLDRGSVPLCRGVPEEAEQHCFLKNRKEFIWENRDFTVEREAMLQYIKDYVLFQRDEERTCGELKGRLDERFVLYNVWCAKPKYWFPALSDGKKACVHGADYRVDHTDEFVKSAHLFESRKECCATFPVACEGVPGGVEAERSRDFSGSAVALFHNYHKLSPAEEAKTTLSKKRSKIVQGDRTRKERRRKIADRRERQVSGI